MHKYFVSDNQYLTPTTLLLTLKKDRADSRPFSFQPGQYAAISFKHGGRPSPARCFSIVSSPTDPGTLQFSMRIKGHFTNGLARLKADDVVRVRGPFGGFVFDSEHNTDTVMLAGGIGITPIMSMIRFATDTNLTNKITLLYSCQNQDDVPFIDQLKTLEKRNPQFKVMFMIGQGPIDKLAGHYVASGRITPEIIDQATGNSYKSKSFFICGPPPFMKGMTSILQDKGATNNQIMTEAFSQGPNNQTGKIRSWPLNMYVLSGVGVALGSFVVMVSDLLKTLPPSSVLSPSSISAVSSLTNSRQANLDQLVNNLPVVVSTAPATSAASSAMQQTGATTTTPAATVPTAVTPTPTPTLKCTTTQSGTRICV